MKKIVSLFVLLLLASGMLSAQSMKIYMPKWKGQTCEDHGLRFDGVTFDGDRLNNQSDQNYSNRNLYEYRAMKPLLVKISVPAGVKTVDVSLADDFVSIVGAPKGSEFIDRTHARIPVLSSSETLTIENPYIKVEQKNNCLYNTYLDFNTATDQNLNFDAYKDSTFIKVEKNNEKNKKETIIQDELSIEKQETYVVIIASHKGKSHITINATGAYNNENTVFGNLKFSEGNDKFVCSENIPCSKQDYVLEIAGRPTTSPINFTNKDNYHPQMTFELEIENEGQYEVDLSKVLVVFSPKENWCTTKSFAVVATNNKQHKTKLAPGEKVTVVSKKFIIDDTKLTKDVNVLTIRSKIIYPTSPEQGKKTEIDLTVTKEFKGGQVAGIGSRLEDGTRYVFNTSPEGNALLGIVKNGNIDTDADSLVRNVKWHKDSANKLSAAGCNTSNANKYVIDLYGGDANDVRSASKYSSINYRLYSGKAVKACETIKLKYK